MSEINLDKIGISLLSGSRDVSTKQTSVASENNKESVTVTNQMADLINLLNGVDPSIDDNVRVAQMKKQIEAHDYIVPISKLAEKLVNHGVLKSIKD